MSSWARHSRCWGPWALTQGRAYSLKGQDSLLAYQTLMDMALSLLALFQMTTGATLVDDRGKRKCRQDTSFHHADSPHG